MGLAQVSALCSRASGAVNQVKGAPVQVYWNWPVGRQPAQRLSWTPGGSHAGPWSTPERPPPWGRVQHLFLCFKGWLAGSGTKPQVLKVREHLTFWVDG